MFYSLPPDQLLSVPKILPPQDESTVPLVVSVTTILLFFALCTQTSRIWIRWPKQLGLDDLTMAFAVAFTLICYGITIAIGVITGGRHTIYVKVDALLQNARISFVFVVFWIWSVTMIKISVCCMLLRVKSYSKSWKIGLWTLNAMLFAISSAVTVTHMFMCQPIRANWELSMIITPGHCWSVDRFVSFTYGYSAWFVLTDVICALLPIAFIWRIKRPLRERIVLVLLMALGLLAAFCGLMKMVNLKPSINSKDPLFDSAPTQIWALAEAFLGIVAANIPCLRKPLERAFHAITGKTIDSITSINRRMYESRRPIDDMELSQEFSLSNHGADVGYKSAVSTKPYKRSDADKEQYTVLPKACYVKHEFEVRSTLYDAQKGDDTNAHAR